MTDESVLRCLAVIPRLPDARGPLLGEDVPTGLVGSRIVRFGTVEDVGGMEGGGLVIDFIPDGEDRERRVVFSFNELGMWITYQGDSNAL